MRTLMITLVVLTLTGPALSQETKPTDPDTDSPMQFSRTLTKQELLELPRRDKGPEISLPEALRIAERFIKKERINISSTYLFEAKWVANGLAEEPSWHFWWVGIKGRRAADDFGVVVSMNGKAKLQLIYRSVGPPPKP